MGRLRHHAKRIALESLGWLLIIAGIAALVLPGPGLLAIFAGLALLATQYTWAERRLKPVEKAAMKAAEDSVRSWPRIVASSSAALLLIIMGIVWGIQPGSPGWWPISDKWWLVGGWGTGGTLIASGIIALGMIMYSYKRFRRSPE